MKRYNYIPRFAAVIIPFIWLGLVVAISFIEAPLKFQAPGLTLEVGVGIGHVVFNAINKVEWALLTLWLFSIAFADLSVAFLIRLVAVICILAMQTFWLLPALDERVFLLQAGKQLQPSPVHLYFITIEIVKVLTLFTLGFTIAKQYLIINETNDYYDFTTDSLSRY
jgi:hypothetical protein